MVQGVVPLFTWWVLTLTLILCQHNGKNSAAPHISEVVDTIVLLKYLRVLERGQSEQEGTTQESDSWLGRGPQKVTALFWASVSPFEKDGAGLDDFSGASGFNDLGFCHGQGPNSQMCSLAPGDPCSIQPSQGQVLTG